MRRPLPAIAVIMMLGVSAISCGQEGNGFSGPSATAPTLDDGAAAYERGDFTTAMSIFRALAEQNEVRAQFNLGVMNYMGQGTAQNYEEAARWYRMAADRGGVRAQFNLGLMYETGEGVPQDYAEALRLYHLAGDQGHPGAPAKIAEISALIESTGGAPDGLTTAPALAAQNANANVAASAAPAVPTPPPPPVAQEEADAQPVAEDIPAPPPAPEEVALSALVVAPSAPPAAAASPPAAPPPSAPAQPAAQPTIADAQAAYERGDFGNAVSQFQVLADQGDARAQYTLGVMYANGQGVGQDPAQALRFYSLAANQGHAAAQFDLGTMYANGDGVAADDMEAMRFFRLAAEQGNGAAQNSFSLISGRKFVEARTAYQDGDYGTAFTLYQVLANYGDAAAQHNLGLMYENGLGVAQDEVEAARWYRLSADQGFPPAVARLNGG